jgi:hypothetical protein
LRPQLQGAGKAGAATRRAFAQVGAPGMIPTRRAAFAQSGSRFRNQIMLQ